MKISDALKLKTTFENRFQSLIEANLRELEHETGCSVYDVHVYMNRGAFNDDKKPLCVESVEIKLMLD